MITAYPLSWPVEYPRTKHPVRSRFGDYNNKPSIAAATDKILNELRMMGCGGLGSVVISTNLNLKNSGLPLSAQSEPDDKGAAVYFKRDGKQLVIACDNYDKAGCNLYAIGKTIEAMRGIERWGCSDFLNRAFTGFQALPQGNGHKQWHEVLGVSADASPDRIKSAYRELVLRNHPDNGGNVDRFQQIQKAYEEALK